LNDNFLVEVKAFETPRLILPGLAVKERVINPKVALKIEFQLPYMNFNSINVQRLILGEEMCRITLLKLVKKMPRPY
jgi:hypothetical protein